MKPLFLEVPFEIKALSDEDGAFEGYGSVFGNRDMDGDVIESGAFKQSLLRHQQNQTQPALLWMHDPSHPVGRYLEIREDERGLYVKGQLILESSQGRDAYALLKGGAVNGLSIGYVAKSWELDKERKTRRLKEIELWEVSLVTFPANPLARVMTLKTRIRPGDVPSQEEMKRLFMRECGMSHQESQVFLDSGYAAYADFVQSSSSPPDEKSGSEELSAAEFEILRAILNN